MIAPTENCPWRKKILCGEVHDDNAYAMGGVAGHAGLFSSARDIHSFSRFVNRCRNGSDDFLPQALVQEFLAKDESVTNRPMRLAGIRRRQVILPAEIFLVPFSRSLGFTGTSIWWDLEKNAHVILLTNRVHPVAKE